MYPHLISTLIAVLGLIACNASQESNIEFDSAHSIALDGQIENGQIVANTSNKTQIRQQITEQVKYTIGQLNGRSAGPDINRSRVEILDIKPRTDGKYDVRYRSNLFVAWPLGGSPPSQFTLILPRSGDFASLNRFFRTYGADEKGDKRCLDWSAHDVTAGIFWYYYRPEKAGCPLRDSSPDVVKIRVTFEISDENTKGKYPEYGKVWEDGRLEVTAIFAKNEEGVMTNNDAGTNSFRQMYASLVGTYGAPKRVNLKPTELPDAYHPMIRAVFATPRGDLDVHLYLVDTLRAMSTSFVQTYETRTKTSDFVSYSGHSGLGTNIRTLATLGTFVAGQYQIFLVNGCDTFAYVDNSLRDKHHAVNPGHGPDKFFDLLTNAMPSYFHMNASSNMAVIKALVGQTKTYRQIMAEFDRYQRVNITGEQDNNWPRPF
jgi:hypothetical protein